MEAASDINQNVEAPSSGTHMRGPHSPRGPAMMMKRKVGDAWHQDHGLQDPCWCGRCLRWQARPARILEAHKQNAYNIKCKPKPQSLQTLPPCTDQPQKETLRCGLTKWVAKLCREKRRQAGKHLRIVRFLYKARYYKNS